MEKSHSVIKWDDNSTQVLINPRTISHERHRVEDTLHSKDVPSGLLWFSSSGSRAQKWIGLTREALLTSAQAVNTHLQSTSSDVWILALPFFHVGGMGIRARAHLSKAQVVTLERWLPHDFAQLALEKNATLSALVPTQVHDLVSANVTAPKSLRAIIVGGGALPHDLYVKARKLGWPLLPSYGLTECSSQVATATLASLTSHEFPEMKLLPHVKAKINSHDFLELKSPSLMTCSVSVQVPPHVAFPIIDGWFLSDDKAHLEGDSLIVLGRGDDFIKIGGESVSISHLESVWHSACESLGVTTDTAILPQPDERLGTAIHLFACDVHEAAVAVELYNSKVMPYERIRAQHQVPEIPRSPLGKVMRGELRKQPALAGR